MIQVTCPTCGTQKSMPDELIGRNAKCKCGEIFRIPEVNPFDEAIRQAANENKKKNDEDQSPITQSTVVEESKPTNQTVESHLQTNQYSALRLVATINRVFGWLTIIFSPLAAVIGMKTISVPMAIVLLVGGIIAGVAQLAFAELLELFMKMHLNTQYMCDRLYAIESKIENQSVQNR